MTPVTALPLAARLAWWGTAWLRGVVGPDEVMDAVSGGTTGAVDRDVTHLVLEPDASDAAPEPLLLDLAAARNAGADAVGAAFPVPGDPAGLRAPRDATGAAIDSGEAALLLGTSAPTALVPVRVGRAVEWTRFAVDRRPPPDLGEADRGLRAALLAGVEALVELDVASWRPEVAEELHHLRTGAPVHAPPGVPERCVDLAGRALHLWAVADLALEDDGGAVSASEVAARRDAIEPLSRAARHALGAACSPDGWPPA